MQTRDSWRGYKFCFAMGVLSIGMITLAAPPSPKVSQFAPADRLVQEVDAFVTSVEPALADEAAFKDQAARVKRDANTLAVVALALSIHDAEHPLKGVAGDLVPAALSVAEAEDLAGAKQAFAKVKDLSAKRDSKGPDATPSWRSLGETDQLMKQSAALYSKLKRQMSGPRFKQRADDNARAAAVLAVIGESLVHSEDYVTNDQETEKWIKFCAEWRDAAGSLGDAIKQGKQEAALESMTKLDASCTQCHQAFKIEIKE